MNEKAEWRRCHADLCRPYSFLLSFVLCLFVVGDDVVTFCSLSFVSSPVFCHGHFLSLFFFAFGRHHRQITPQIWQFCIENTRARENVEPLPHSRNEFAICGRRKFSSKEEEILSKRMQREGEIEGEKRKRKRKGQLQPVNNTFAHRHKPTSTAHTRGFKYVKEMRVVLFYS